MNHYMILRRLVLEMAQKISSNTLVLQKQSSLGYILEGLFSEADYVSLQKKSFANREARTNLFVDKLKKGDPIDLTNGETAIIDKVKINDKEYTKDNFEELKTDLTALKGRDTLKFFSGDKSYNISAFAKTTELGGKGKGGTLGPERKALADLQAQVSEIGQPFTLEVGGVSYKDIDGVVNVKENKKADFAFTQKGNPVVYVSYKPGSSPKDILSYGGITHVKDSGEVQSFIKAVQDRTSQMKAGDVEYGAPVIDPDVIQKTMFGSQAGTEVPGENNVQVIVQGSNLKLTKSGDDSYSLEANHIITPGTVPTEGDYAPYYNARYADDRSQFGIKNCRFNVVPMGARKNIKSPF